MELKDIDLATAMKNLSKADKLLRDNVSSFEDYDMMESVYYTLSAMMRCCETELQKIDEAHTYAEHIRKVHDFGRRGMFGEPGRGKSAIIKEHCEKNGIPFIDLKTPSNILGENTLLGTAIKMPVCTCKTTSNAHSINCPDHPVNKLPPVKK